MLTPIQATWDNM